jgi:transcriptional regulator with XRE-family HTH domain
MEMSVGGTFAERLTTLRETIKRKDGKRYSLRDFTAACQEVNGETLSPEYVRKLLSGEAANPTKSVMEALAGMFDVPVDYFFDDARGAAMQEDLKLGAALRDAGVQTLAMRAVNLDPGQQARVLAYIEEIRRREAAHSGEVDQWGDTSPPEGR